MTRPRLGELFAGYGGLGLGVGRVFDVDLAWVSEYEPPTEKNPRPSQAAAAVLAHHWPDVPNHGDITTINWAEVEPIDVLTGGFPCQDVSAAGKRAGLRPGTRSGLWSHMAYAIGQLRPRLVVAENVRGLLNADANSNVEPCPGCVGDGPDVTHLRALGAVLGDLADIGYDAAWCGLRASDVGAPHGRFRVFVVAWPADIEGDPWRVGNGDDDAPADTGREAVGFRAGLRPSRPNGLGRGRLDDDVAPAPATDAEGDGRHEGRAERAWLVGRPDVAERGATVANAGREHGERWSDAVTEGARPEGPPGESERSTEAPGWGPYEPAIRRWEQVLGRLAPPPTERGPKGGDRLSPRFVEWMMGLPDGWVTDVPGVGRNDQLKVLGNGVVPAQASAATSHLLANRQAVVS